MDKLRFEFMVKQSEDPKTNVMCITSIMDIDKNIYLIPDKLQPAKLHDEVTKTQIFQKVKTTLQKRHEKRQVWISLTQELRKTYVDEDGNMQFRGYLLEQISLQSEQPVLNETSAEALTRILENFSELKKEPKQSNLKKLYEKFIIEKFTKKTSSVSQWINIFENECIRIGIDKDIEKIQVFRLFLDDPGQDWYNSMLIKYTVNSEWCIWKKNFCETFVNKGWTPIRYAFTFKYRQGTLLEYALKKERLLLEVNKVIDKHTLIDLIVIGLPNFVADEINRDNLQDTEDLFSSIRGLEHLVNRRLEPRGIDSESKIKGRTLKDQPCRICEKEKKGTRFHPESICWYKNRDNYRLKKEPIIRNVNNSELEMSLNEIDPKN